MKTLLGKLWRGLPPRARRWSVWFAEARFSASVAAVVTDDEGRVLLLEHRFRVGSGWGIPGGFINPGEQPEEALRRELREEIGLELCDARLAFVRTLKRPRHIEIVFCCTGSLSLQDVEPRGMEIISLDWFAPEDLESTLSADQRRLIRRALDS